MDRVSTMRRLLQAAGFVLMLAGPARLQAQADYRVQATFISPASDLAVDVLALAPGQEVPEDAPGYQAWVVERARRSNRKLLLSGEWPLRAAFAADGYGLAMEQATGPAAGVLHLFQRLQGLRYDALPKPGAALWAFAEREGLPPAEAARRAERFVAWSADGSALLAELSQPGTDAAPERWLVAYDVRAQAASLDLNWLNRGWPQTQAPGRDVLAELEYPATERAHERLQRAFAAMTQPSGGEELVPQPGDPLPPPRKSDAARAAKASRFARPTPPPQAGPPPIARKLRASAAGGALLYALEQPGRGTQPARTWFCLFDLQTGRPSMDLRVLNQPATPNPVASGEVP